MTTATEIPTAPATTKKSKGKRKIVSGEVVELTGEQLEAFGRELDAIRQRVIEDRKDRDIGYGILRMSEDQPWRPYYLGNPIWAALLATFFQYGVALHDVEVERIAAGETTLREKRGLLKGIWEKVRRQTLKDYVLFP